MSPTFFASIAELVPEPLRQCCGSATDPDVFGPPGSGSFHRQAKIFKKNLLFCDFFNTFYQCSGSVESVCFWVVLGLPDPHPGPLDRRTDPQHCIAEYQCICWSGSSEKEEFQLKMGLAEEVFGNHSSTSQIDLHGNPYACDCHLMPLFDWLKTTRARLVNKVKHNNRTNSAVSTF